MTLRQSIDDWMADNFAEPWASYVEEKRRRGELARIGDVWVDVPNVIDRVFSCDPGTCSPGLRKRGHESCCAEFLVDVTKNEAKILARHFDGISAFLAARDEDWARRRPSFEQLLVPHDDNPFSRVLAKRKRRCAFSFLDEGQIRCGIHGYAMARGLDVHQVKPKLCFLFPLLLQDLAGGGFIITVIDEENSGLVGFTSYRELPCLWGEKTFGAVADGARPFYDDHRSTLTHLFGRSFVRGLDRLAEERGVRSRDAGVVLLTRKKKRRN